jgi:hypothetical protein
LYHCDENKVKGKELSIHTVRKTIGQNPKKGEEIEITVRYGRDYKIRIRLSTVD